jgi:DNA-binding LytR/AlgR family response regulator
MKPLRAIVVDDEPYVRADLIRVLEALDIEVVGVAEDGVRAIQLIDTVEADVIFLDIHMPALDGLSVASRTVHEGPNRARPPIVFVTAHAEHATSAFDLDACDYVLKPVTQERITRALSRVLRRVQIDETERDAPRLRVTDTKGSRFIDVRRIEVFRAVEKYVSFEMGGEEHLIRESLDDLETRFAPLGFLRAHRAHLVRTSAVARTEDAEHGLVLVLTGGARVPVSKRMRAQVLRGLGAR